MSAAIVMLAVCGNLSSTAIKDLKGDELINAIEGQSFVMSANQMVPMGAPSKMLDGSNFVKIEGNTIESALPYFGRATSVPYGGGTALHFKAEILEYKIMTKAKSTMVYVKTRNTEDVYEYNFDIYDNGTAYLSVNAINRDPVRFHGKIKAK